MLLKFPEARASRITERFDRAIAAAEMATDSLLGLAGSPRDAYAVAVPYQALLADLIGGWMHVIISIAVLKREKTSVDGEQRLIQADFYSVHVLPRVHALAETVSAGEIS